jgi:hypothetical protein
MSIKQYLRQNFFVDAYLKRKRIASWIRNDYPIPVPHDIKQITIQYYSIAHRLETLVETGTYLGDMVWAQRDHFKRIYSIELSGELFLKAKKRFHKQKHIRIIQGDSSEQIEKVLSEVGGPSLFWLDGHYSGGITARGSTICPIYAELEHVFNSTFSHIILVDDARLFTGNDDYPRLEDLQKFISDNSAYRVKVENDIIVLSQ